MVKIAPLVSSCRLMGTVGIIKDGQVKEEQVEIGAFKAGCGLHRAMSVARAECGEIALRGLEGLPHHSSPCYDSRRRASAAIASCIWAREEHIRCSFRPCAQYIHGRPAATATASRRVAVLVIWPGLCARTAIYVVRAV